MASRKFCRQGDMIQKLAESNKEMIDWYVSTIQQALRIKYDVAQRVKAYLVAEKLFNPYL